MRPLVDEQQGIAKRIVVVGKDEAEIDLPAGLVAVEQQNCALCVLLGEERCVKQLSVVAHDVELFMRMRGDPVDRCERRFLDLPVGRFIQLRGKGFFCIAPPFYGKIHDIVAKPEKKREQRQKNPEQHPSNPLLFSEPCPEAKRARPDDPRQQHDEIVAQAIGKARGENSVK